MSRIGQYCKAYPLERLEEFAQWPADVSARLRAASAPDDDPNVYVFVQQDLAVTGGIFPEEDVLFDASDPAWLAFCRDVLEFQVPADAQS